MNILQQYGCRGRVDLVDVPESMEAISVATDGQLMEWRLLGGSTQKSAPVLFSPQSANSYTLFWTIEESQNDDADDAIGRCNGGDSGGFTHRAKIQRY